jgi:hypothetical protein
MAGLPSGDGGLEEEEEEEEEELALFMRGRDCWW